MKCPKCRLINPPEAQRCDCGYDFTSQTMQGSYDRQVAGTYSARWKRSFTVGVVISVVVLVLGLLRTMAGETVDGAVLLLAGLGASPGVVSA
jgi:hypothetical protein